VPSDASIGVRALGHGGGAGGGAKSCDRDDWIGVWTVWRRCNVPAVSTAL
jgi:hypothetical protein